MQPFRKHTGVVVPLDKVNVDTDQIIPKQFLKRIERTGFGEFLFYDWRFSGEETSAQRSSEKSRKKTADFVLQPAALCQGFDPGRGKEFWLRLFARACRLGAGGFWFPGGDRFVVRRHLCQQQPEEWPADRRLNDEQVAEIMRRAKEIDGYELTVDLETLRVEDGRGFAATFAMDEFSRHCLLNGLDDIGLTLQHEAEIAAYEAKHPLRAEMKAICRDIVNLANPRNCVI